MSRMGDLANAFDVPEEQSTNVGWANRLGEILTTRPQYDETVQYKTASPLVNITEGDIGRATEAAMGVSGGGMKVETPKGIKAYHSSPHDFDKFDLAKIGTGEGAQTYGHGLYFAENPAVSGQGGQYWQQFKQHPNFTPAEAQAAIELHAAGFDRDKAKQLLSQRMKEEFAPYGQRGREEAQLYKEHLDALDLLHSDKPVGPRTYEVNINADPAHMLDWDKGLYQQSPHVQKALETYGIRAEPDKMKAYTDALYDALHKTDTNARLPPQPFDATGPEIYRSGKLSPRRSASEASNALSNAGIPGIKYLDQGSRTVPATLERMQRELADYTARGNKSAVAALEQQIADAQKAALSSNYVIFDPNIIDITKKYAVPGALTAGGMGALAAQDEYRQ